MAGHHDRPDARRIGGRQGSPPPRTNWSSKDPPTVVAQKPSIDSTATTPDHPHEPNRWSLPPWPTGGPITLANDKLIAGGGLTCVCGGAGTVAPALRDAFAEIYQRHAGVSAEEGTAWLEEQRAANQTFGQRTDLWNACRL